MERAKIRLRGALRRRRFIHASVCLHARKVANRTHAVREPRAIPNAADWCARIAATWSEIGMFEWKLAPCRYTRMSLAATQSSPQLPHPAVSGSGYPAAAFDFVESGLAYTTERACAQFQQCQTGGLPAPDIRHVTGQQLCLGLREFAIERYGVLAPCVLRHWNISRTEDFGRIVYSLIEAERLAKSPDDSIDDFHAVYDFDEAFSLAALSSRIGAH